MDKISINAVYPGLEAVVGPDGRCLGVIVPARAFPHKKCFFLYEDCCFYYGMTSQEAYAASQNKKV